MAWQLIPDDPTNEGLGFIVCSLAFCELIVSSWTGVEGWLGISTRWIILRWVVVSLVTAVGLEVLDFLRDTPSLSLSRIAGEFGLLILGVLVLTLPAAFIGCSVGGAIREQSQLHS